MTRESTRGSTRESNQSRSAFKSTQRSTQGSTRKSSLKSQGVLHRLIDKRRKWFVPENHVNFNDNENQIETFDGDNNSNKEDLFYDSLEKQKAIINRNMNNIKIGIMKNDNWKIIGLSKTGIYFEQYSYNTKEPSKRILMSKKFFIEHAIIDDDIEIDEEGIPVKEIWPFLFFKKKDFINGGKRTRKRRRINKTRKN
jgi:hypothetical protein